MVTDNSRFLLLAVGELCGILNKIKDLEFEFFCVVLYLVSSKWN